MLKQTSIDTFLDLGEREFKMTDVKGPIYKDHLEKDTLQVAAEMYLYVVQNLYH